MKKTKIFLIVIIVFFGFPKFIFADGDDDYQNFITTANPYYSSLSKNELNEIYKYMETAQALLQGNMEYNESWSNTERENIALAIAISIETERGAQPAEFTSNGVIYRYNKDASNADEYWTQDSVSDLEATIQIINPLYVDKKTSDFMEDHEGRWIQCKDSHKINYQHYVDKTNMCDPETIIKFDSTSEVSKKATIEGNATHIPSITLDTETTDLEKYPLTFFILEESVFLLE